MTLSFIPLGIGDAFSAEHYSASLAVCFDDGSHRRWLLVDCPHPIRKMLREGGVAAGVPDLDVGDFEGLVLTHLHADHASGLEGWGFFHHFALGRPAQVLTHPDVAAKMWTSLAPSMSTLLQGPDREPTPFEQRDFFDVRTFTDVAEIGPFTVRCRTTLHHIPTIALRIEAGGAVLGYSADTAFDPGLIEWLADASVIVHESNLGGAHTPFQELAALPDSLRAKMRLIAFPDGFQPRGIDPLVQGERVAVGAG